MSAQEKAKQAERTHQSLYLNPGVYSERVRDVAAETRVRRLTQEKERQRCSKWRFECERVNIEIDKNRGIEPEPLPSTEMIYRPDWRDHSSAKWVSPVLHHKSESL